MKSTATDFTRLTFILKIWTSKADTPTTTTASDTVYIHLSDLVLVVVKIILNLILEEET